MRQGKPVKGEAMVLNWKSFSEVTAETVKTGNSPVQEYRKEPSAIVLSVGRKRKSQ